MHCLLDFHISNSFYHDSFWLVSYGILEPSWYFTTQQHLGEANFSLCWQHVMSFHFYVSYFELCNPHGWMVKTTFQDLFNGKHIFHVFSIKGKVMIDLSFFVSWKSPMLWDCSYLYVALSQEQSAEFFVSLSRLLVWVLIYVMVVMSSCTTKVHPVVPFLEKKQSVIVSAWVSTYGYHNCPPWNTLNTNLLEVHIRESNSRYFHCNEINF